MHVQEDRHSSFLCRGENPFLRRRDFRPMRRVRPVTIMILWQRVLAAIAGGDMVNVHDRHEIHIGILPQPFRRFVIPAQPLGKTNGDPAPAYFEGVLASEHPDHRPPRCRLVTFADDQPLNRTAFKRFCQREFLRERMVVSHSFNKR